MLFHIAQVHKPEDCPYGRGGSPSLVDRTVSGVKVVGSYGAFMEHTVYIIAEADDVDSLNRFLLPGMKTCSTRITPVSDHPLPTTTNP
jgi:hypothetical protein